MVREPKFRCCECNKSLELIDIFSITDKTVFIPGIGERHPNKKYCEGCFKKVTKPVKELEIENNDMSLDDGSNIKKDKGLFERLRKKRLEIARSKKLPAYYIFYDKTLKDIVSKKPTTKREMLRINGVGEVKFEEFGDVFLEEILKYRR